MKQRERVHRALSRYGRQENLFPNCLEFGRNAAKQDRDEPWQGERI